MCEVVRSTFEGYIPVVEAAVRGADFIAIDCEFTGLVDESKGKHSLFDTIEERYTKTKNNITQFTLSQIGVATFKKHSSINKYEACAFNFYLFPTTCGPIDVCFLCQASSLKFLCKFNFDFNKFIYEGVSFMNEQQEKILEDHLVQRKDFKQLERTSSDKELNEVISKISAWILKSSVNEILTLHSGEIKGLECYLIHTVIRNRFHTVWTESSTLGDIMVVKVSPERRKELETKAKILAEKQQISDKNALLGFTRVFRMLNKYKKPLVGHNCLLDLCLMYEKFHKPLPDRWDDFKEETHSLFPVIFDTKFIAKNQRKVLDGIGVLESTSLEDLFLSMKSSKFSCYVLFSPDVIHSPGFGRYNGSHNPHEAGYDAFQIGFTFVKLAHLITFHNVKSMEMKPCLFRDYMTALKPVANCIFITRARILHIKLDEDDPTLEQPPLLIVKAVKKTDSLSLDQLAQWFSPYGFVDIKMTGKSQALIATRSFRCAEDILTAFHQHDSVRISKYNKWKHSSTVRNLMWLETNFAEEARFVDMDTGQLMTWNTFLPQKDHLINL